MSDTALIGARLFRSTMGRFATGVTVVTVAPNDGHPHAMATNAFLSVSLDPPLMLVSLNNRSRMNAHLHCGRRYGITVLAASQEEHSRHFGGRPVEGLEVNWLPRLDTDPPLHAAVFVQVVNFQIRWWQFFTRTPDIMALCFRLQADSAWCIVPYFFSSSL